LAALEEPLADPESPRRGLMGDVAMAVAEDREDRARRWFAEDVGPLRRVAAGAAARLLRRDVALRAIVAEAIVDDDASVRDAALMRLRLEDGDAELRAVVEQALVQQPLRWTCPECERVNTL